MGAESPGRPVGLLNRVYTSRVKEWADNGRNAAMLSAFQELPALIGDSGKIITGPRFSQERNAHLFRYLAPPPVSLHRLGYAGMNEPFSLMR